MAAEPGTTPRTYTRVTSYDVSVFPPGIECIDSETWKLTVEYRGHDLWAVKRHSMCLRREGTWDYERRPSERTDGWLASCRFPLDEALALAAEHAPRVTINDLTAVEVLERHLARHPNGHCDA